jgi:UDPglucose--hexose-1-phosphate uridylyltransferase
MSNRTDVLLADGRRLSYYDDDGPGADRSAPDRRDLPPTATSAQIRWDPLFQDWTVVASHRQARTYKPADEHCPLCPSRGGRQTEVPAADYDVVVFENRFPSLSGQPGGAASGQPGDAAGPVPVPAQVLGRAAPGVGRCEVVCFTSDHDTSFSQLPRRRVRTVLGALADRTAELSQVDGVEYVFCFENRGEEIGVTLSHPHGQIYAYPFVPARMARVVRAAREHRQETGGCLQCEVVAAEQIAGERVVVTSPGWTAYVPFAARWPYEVRIVARRHVPDLAALTDAERDDLAAVYLDVLQRLDRVFDLAAPTPYIAGWQQAPVRAGRDLWHLAVEVFTIRRAPGKLKYLAGSESGAAVWINDVLPEVAARRLRTAGVPGALPSSLGVP